MKIKFFRICFFVLAVLPQLTAQNSIENGFIRDDETDEEIEFIEESAGSGIPVSSAEEHRLKNELLTDKFYVYQKLSYPVNYSLKAGINAAAYAGFAGLEKNGVLSNFSLYNFGLRFTPVFLLTDRKTLKPALSFLAGNIKMPSIFSRFEKPEYTNVKPHYRKITVPPENILSLSNTGKNIFAGAELNTPHLGLVFSAQNTGKENRLNYRLYAAFKKHDFVNPHAALNTAFFSAFYPELKKGEKKPFYSRLYGAEIIFTDNIFHAEALGAFRRLPEKGVAASCKTEAGFFYNCAGGAAGFSWALSENKLKTMSVRKDKFFAFVRPEFKYGGFSAKAVYSYSAAVEKKTKNKKTSGGEKFLDAHSYGADFKISRKTAEFKNGFFYGNGIYNLNAILRLKNLGRYFHHFTAICKFEMQDKKINRFCLKKYSVSTAISFTPLAGLELGAGGLVSQQNTVKKIKSSPPVREWQKLYWQSRLFLNYSVKKHKLKHSGGFNIKLENKEPYFSVSISYKLAGS